MNILSSLLTILGVIFVGFLTKRKKVLNEVQIEGFEVFLFKISMPCYLFCATANRNIEELFNLNFILSYFLTFLSVAVLVLFVQRKHSKSEICMKILASSYSNTSMYSVPVITFMFGNSVSGVIANVLQVVFIQFIFLTMLSFFKNKDGSVYKKFVVVLTNPLIIAPIVGVFVSYFKLNQYLDVFLSIVKTLGGVNSGLALFTFGLNISFPKKMNSEERRGIFTIVFIKNIIHPFFAFIVGKYIFNLEKYWLCSLILIASAPTAFVIYLISKKHKICQEQIRIVVTLSCILSLFSLLFLSMIF